MNKVMFILVIITILLGIGRIAGLNYYVDKEEQQKYDKIFALEAEIKALSKNSALMAVIKNCKKENIANPEKTIEQLTAIRDSMLPPPVAEVEDPNAFAELDNKTTPSKPEAEQATPIIRTPKSELLYFPL